MSYFFVTARRGSAPGSSLATSGGVEPAFGNDVPLFNRIGALGANDWARDDDASLYRLGDGWSLTDQGFLAGLSGQPLFGAAEAGAPLSPAALGTAGVVLDQVQVSPAALVITSDAPLDAAIELALSDALAAAGPQTVTVSQVAEVALRIGDGLVSTDAGRALDFTAVESGARTITLSGVEDLTVDAASSRADGGLQLTAALRADDEQAHQATVLGSVFADSVVLTADAGNAVAGAANIAVSVHLGMGDDTFDSRSNGTLATRDTVIGGSGGDTIRAGAGEDLLFGDYDATLPATDRASGDLVDLIGSPAAAGLPGFATAAAVVSLGFVGSEANFRNLVGYYYTDAETGQRIGRLVWDEKQANAEAREQRALAAAITLDDLSQAEVGSLQFFILPNGAAVNRVTGITDNESAARAATAGGRDGLIDLFEGSQQGKVIVTTGAKGQGQVWLDLDGNGQLSAGDRLLVGQTTNTLTSDTGITMGSAPVVFAPATSAAGGTVFSGFFTDNALNPLGHDMAKRVGDIGDAFLDRPNDPSQLLNPDAPVVLGLLGFEDTYAGRSLLAGPIDHEDAVLQVAVRYRVQPAFGNDLLVGGAGDDVIYGDDNATSLTTAAGGNDTIYGDGDPVVIAPCNSGLGIAQWVNGTGLTVFGTTDGVTYSVSQGDLADAGHFEVGAARAGIAPAAWPGVGLGISANTNTGRDGSDYLGNPSNPEINPTVNGQDQLGFGLPTAADGVNLCFGTFYGHDGTDGSRIEGAWVLLGTDQNGDHLLTGAEITGRALVLADGTVLQQQGGLVAEGHAVAPDGSALPVGTGNAYAVDNPGRFSLTIQSSGGPEFNQVALESGGLWERQPDGTYVQVQNADVADFLVRGFTYNPAAGNDTIFGGGGTDTIIGGGDRGSFGFEITVSLLGSSAGYDNALGWFQGPNPTQGVLLDDRVQSGPVFSVAGDNPFDSPTYDSGNAKGSGSVVIPIASNTLDDIGFFIVPGVGVSRQSPTGVVPFAPGTVVDFVADANGGLNVRDAADPSGPSFGRIFTTSPDLNPDGGVYAISNPGISDGAAVAAGDQRPITSLGALYADSDSRDLIGFEDQPRATGDGDFNDVVLKVTIAIAPDAAVGDRLTGNAGADTFIWNGAGSGALAGSRADGFDLITDFQAGTDILRFDEFAAGTARAIDVTWQGHAAVLVFDSLYAAGTGVLIDNTTLAGLAPGSIVFV